MANVWWFFKNVQDLYNVDQTEYATKVVADHHFWIGRYPKVARHRSQSLTSLIQTYDEQGIPNTKKPRPINKGDNVWVYNLRCLGDSNKTICQTLQFLHDHEINLHVYTLENSTAPLLCIFKEICEPSLIDGKKKKNGVGRRPFHCHYLTLTDEGKKIPERYCTDETYSFKQAFSDIQNPSFFKEYKGQDMNHIIGENKFRAIINQCKASLRKKEIPIVPKRDK